MDDSEMCVTSSPWHGGVAINLSVNMSLSAVHKEWLQQFAPIFWGDMCKAVDLGFLVAFEVGSGDFFCGFF